MLKKIFKFKQLSTVITYFLILTLLIHSVAAEGLIKAKEENNITPVVSEEPLGIVSEVVSLRTEHSKTYERSDGSYSEVSSVLPIHYKKDGEYHEIDNRLETIKGKKETYQNKSSYYQVTFPKDLTDPIEIQFGKYNFSMQMTSNQKDENSEEVPSSSNDEEEEEDVDEEDAEAVTPSSITVEDVKETDKPSAYAEKSTGKRERHRWKKSRIKNRKEKTEASKDQKNSVSKKGMAFEEMLPSFKVGEITYENETEDATIVFETLPTQIKESIVLKNANAVSDSYTYEIQAEGLKANKEKDGSILFYKKNKKKPVFMLESAFMFDSSEERNLSYEIQTELVKKGDKYQLTYTPSKEWLNDAVYPVTIDPTIVFYDFNSTLFEAQGYTTLQSPNTVASVNATVTLGTSNVGTYYIRLNNGISFDSPHVNRDHALLSSKLYLNTSTFDSNTSVEVRSIKSSWQPWLLTHNNRPTLDTTVLDYTMAEHTIALDITQYMKIFFTDQFVMNDFHGLAITALENKRCDIYSYNDWRSPYIITEYSALSGDYTNQSTHSVSAGKAGTITVNDFTGRMQFEAEDLAIPGNRMPVSIKRVKTLDPISSNTGFDGLFYTNYHQKLVLDWDTGYWKFQTEKGGYIYFKSGDSSYVDEQGAGYELFMYGRYPDDYQNIHIKNPDGHILQFNASGNLVRIEEEKKQAEPNFIDIKYVSGDRIDMITDGAGGRYKFVYQGNQITEIQYIGKTGNTVIKKVSYHIERTPSPLTNFTVTYPSGKKSYYGISYDYTITSIFNDDMSGVRVQYNYPFYPYLSSVMSVTEIGRNSTHGDSLTYTYEPQQTTIEDENGNKEIYQFDRSGQVTSVRNKEGEAVFSIYGGQQRQLLGFSPIRSTNIGNNLTEYVSYTATIQNHFHDNSIPVLNNKFYQEIHTSRDTTVEGTLHTLSSIVYKKGDTLTYGGWIKGNLLDASEGSLSDRGVSIQIRMYPIGSQTPKIQEVKPNHHVTDWQYVLDEVTLEEPLSKVDVLIRMKGQANRVFVSQLELKRVNTEDVTPEPSATPEPPTSPLPTPQLDAYGNILKEWDERGTVTEYTYDAAGNQRSSKKTANGKELITNTNYDSDRNMVTGEAGTDGAWWYYGYTNDKKLTSDHDGYAYITEYKYNAEDEISSKTFYANEYQASLNNPDAVVNYGYGMDQQTITTANNAYSILYNAFGDISEIKRGTQRLASYEYQKNSNRIPTKINYGNGQSITYQYNSKNQLTSDGQGTYNYNDQGELERITDSVNQTRTEIKDGKTSVYNSTNNTLLHHYEDKGSVYSFEKFGNLYKTEKIAEDTSNGMYEEMFNQSGSLAYHKTITDGFGRLQRNEVKQSNKTSNLITKSYDYRNLSGNRTTEQIEKVNYTLGTSATTSDTFTYDSLGNIRTIQNQNGLTRYQYNSLGQLVREDNPVQNTSIFYQYSEGNITKKEEYTYTTSTTPAPGTLQNQINYGYGNSGWKDLLTSYNGQSISYDSIGNPTSYRGSTLTWEKGRQLKTNVKNGVATNYMYDVNGLRTKKTVGNTIHQYTYQDGKLIAYEQGSNHQMVFSYDNEGNPFGLWYNGTQYYYQTNLQGDVIGILNSSGSRLVTYHYDAWGKPIGTIPTSGIGAVNPLRYRGYVFDTDTGLFYVSSRYYDPETGRFLNADDSGMLLLDQGNILQYNLFTYCFNNPIIYIDIE